MLRRTKVCQKSMPAFPFKPAPYTGPSVETVMKKRQALLNPAAFTAYKSPVMLVEGKNQYVWDEQGKRYLDMFGGVCTTSIGHNNDRIVAAAHEQAKKIAHATLLYPHNNVVELSESLKAKLPKEHDWVFAYTNSGSEANDFAIMMARLYTGRHTVAALRTAYHGFTEVCRNLISVKNWKHPLPIAPGILRVIPADTYRGVLGTNWPEDVAKYNSDLDHMINTEAGGKLAAFIAERIQGVGGISTYQKGFLPKVYESVRAAGGLCISDEVQCGFGRLGSHYWGFQTEGLIPDIITGAKSVANGWPMGFVAAKREVAEAMRGVLWFNTFGGNPISCAVANEVIKIIDEENLQEHAVNFGDTIGDGLKKIQAKYPILGDVRGTGFISGLEFVKDPTTKEPAPEMALNVMEKLKEHGILVGKSGNFGNVIRLQGPMTASLEDAEFFLYTLEEVLKSGV